MYSTSPEGSLRHLFVSHQCPKENLARERLNLNLVYIYMNKEQIFLALVEKTFWVFGKEGERLWSNVDWEERKD